MCWLRNTKQKKIDKLSRISTENSIRYCSTNFDIFQQLVIDESNLLMIDVAPDIILVYCWILFWRSLSSRCTRMFIDDFLSVSKTTDRWNKIFILLGFNMFFDRNREGIGVDNKETNSFLLPPNYSSILLFLLLSIRVLTHLPDEKKNEEDEENRIEWDK